MAIDLDLDIAFVLHVYILAHNVHVLDTRTWPPAPSTPTVSPTFMLDATHTTLMCACQGCMRLEVHP
jgi:hypothetical protein